MKHKFSTNLANYPVLLLALALGLGFSSCEWFKPARDTKNDKVVTEDDIGEIQGKKVYDPLTGTWRIVREVNGKVDTVHWRELPEESYPPITSDGSWANVNGNAGGLPNASGETHTISILLPFLAQGYQPATVNDNSLWALHFYGGAKLAYQDLEKEGVHLDVSVLDSDGSGSRLRKLMNEAPLQKAELIIGPYKRDNVMLVEPFTKTRHKALVVPYTASMGLATADPGYIQVNPSLKSHCEAIARHARANYNTEDIVLVARSKDAERSRLAYFQEANAAIEGNRDSSFREYIVGNPMGEVMETELDSFIRPGKTNVFIVPSWSNEGFVYSLLRQLMVKQSEGEEIVVYGMPQWMNFEQIDYDFYEKLHVHVSSASYIDYDDERIRQFRKKFFDTYGTIPREEAFTGYDIMRYFGKMLDKWGAEFPAKIDREPFDVLHGRFDFERVVLEPEKHREDLNYYDQLENKFVHILEFRDYHFQLAD
ncbi:MAG: hypothetical protein ACE5FF_01750 [Saprospiraceae bacterium]